MRSLIVLLIIFFLINSYNAKLLFDKIYMSSLYGNDAGDQFKVTPFSPGIRESLTIQFDIGSSTFIGSDISATANIYSNDNITLFSVAVLMYNNDNPVPTIGTSSSTLSSINYMELKQQKPNQPSLKVGSVENFSFSISVNLTVFLKGSNSFYDSYYLGLLYTEKNSPIEVKFNDYPFSFNAPSYNSSNENIIFSNFENQQFTSYGLDYCQTVSTLKIDTKKSASYGLYYVFNNDVISKKLQFIKKDKDSGKDLYYYNNDYLNNQNFKIVDGVNGQDRFSIQELGQCNLLTLIQSEIQVSYSFVNGWSATYITLVSNSKIESLMLESYGFKVVPISVQSQVSQKWYSMVRLTEQTSNVTIAINPQAWSNTINFPTTSVSIQPTTCTIQLLSSTFYKTSSTKFSYENNQIQILVEIPSLPSLGRLNSIDYNCGGTVFYSDKEIYNSTYYSKLISIPDSLVTGDLITIFVYGNFENVGRVLFNSSDFRFNYQDSSAILTSSTVGEQIPLFSGRYYFYASCGVQQGRFQTPDFKFTFLTADKLTSLSEDSYVISTSFPQAFIGDGSNLVWSPSVPISSDTPQMSYRLSNIASGVNNVVLKGFSFNKRDYVNPGVTIKFNWSSSKLVDDEFIISVWDSIGIGADTCKFMYANNVFSLTPGTNIKSMLKVNNSFSIDFSYKLKFNRYFCLTAPVIDCSDIRGNRLYEDKFSVIQLKNAFFTGFNECLSSSIVPPPQIRLMANFINFLSPSRVYFSMLFSDLDTSSLDLYTITIGIYNDYDNRGPLETTFDINFNSIDPITNTAIAKGTAIFTMDSTTKSSNKFISITVFKTSNPLSSYTLSTSELKFIDKSFQINQTTTTVITSQFTLRNLNYQGPKSFLGNLILKNEGPINYVISSPEMSNIKNLTLSFKDKYSVYKESTVYIKGDTTTFVSLAGNDLSISFITLSYYNMDVYIENVCDLFDNCYNLSPTGINTSRNYDSTKVPPTTVNQLVIGNPTFSKIYIDTSSNNRKTMITIDLKNGANSFIPFYGQDPIFYVSEKESNDQIKCPLKQVRAGSSVFTCDLEVPFLWGSRGVGECSVWNMVRQDGSIYGSKVPQCQIFLYVQYLANPVIWEISADMGSTILYISGSNLDLIPSRIIDDQSLLVSTSQFITLNNTMGYYILKSPVTTPFNVSFNWGGEGTKVISVFIKTCLKSDCNGNGNCNITTFTCNCNQGWGGSDCSIDQTYQCINNCSNHGSCSIDKVCNCDTGYSGVSCNLYLPDIGLSVGVNKSQDQPSVNVGSFGTSTNNKSLELNEYTKSSEYSILIPYIQEIDFNGKLVRNFTFTKDSWSVQSINSTFTLYNTTLTEFSTVLITLEIIKTETTREWAGQLLNLPENSIKYSVRIQNYTFSSNLNNLQMIYQASPSSKLSEECEIKQAIAWGAKKSTDMHWVTLPNNQVSLYGRFSNNMIADGKIISTSNEGLEFGTTIQVKVNIPFFKDFVELDPDFSVLVNNDLTPEEYDECGIKIEKSSSSRKWVIPVAVVVSVVGAAILVIASISILYSKNTTIRTKLLRFKSKLRGNNNVSMRNL